MEMPLPALATLAEPQRRDCRWMRPQTPGTASASAFASPRHASRRERCCNAPTKVRSLRLPNLHGRCMMSPRPCLNRRLRAVCSQRSSGCGCATWGACASVAWRPGGLGTQSPIATSSTNTSAQQTPAPPPMLTPRWWRGEAAAAAAGRRWEEAPIARDRAASLLRWGGRAPAARRTAARE
jgi:hypothetical protein